MMQGRCEHEKSCCNDYRRYYCHEIWSCDAGPDPGCQWWWFDRSRPGTAGDCRSWGSWIFQCAQRSHNTADDVWFGKNGWSVCRAGRRQRHCCDPRDRYTGRNSLYVRFGSKNKQACLSYRSHARRFRNRTGRTGKYPGGSNGRCQRWSLGQRRITYF